MKKTGPQTVEERTANQPEGLDPQELYAWRRNRTIAGRDQLLANAAERTATKKLNETEPPKALPEDSDNTAAALRAMNRTRRRARGGNSGRVTTGPGATPGVGAGGAPLTLIGS